MIECHKLKKCIATRLITCIIYNCWQCVCVHKIIIALRIYISNYILYNINFYYMIRLVVICCTCLCFLWKNVHMHGWTSLKETWNNNIVTLERQKFFCAFNCNEGPFRTCGDILQHCNTAQNSILGNTHICNTTHNCNTKHNSNLGNTQSIIIQIILYMYSQY